jgi:hypothetical protein
MFARSKPPTISLPLYNSPRPRTHPARRNKTRYMALGLVSFLVFVTIFAFGRAAPLIRSNPQWDSAMITVQNAANFQSNIEAVTEIYRGSKQDVDDIDHLVIVTGHAILLDKANYLKDEAWVLESFQKGGQVQTFVDHILRGIEIAKEDPRSLLVFSGYVLWYCLTLVVRLVRWRDREVKDNRTGISPTIYSGVIEPWINSF